MEVVRSSVWPSTRCLAINFVVLRSHQPRGKECLSRHQAHRRLDISRWVLVAFRCLFVVSVAHGRSVIPESTHQDTVGAFARTVRDAVYALDVMYGVDPRDNYTLAQRGKTPDGGYSQFWTNSDALQNATFGLPWQSFWALVSEEQQTSLLGLIEMIEGAGATVINGTELPDYQTIVSPDGWDWCVHSLPTWRVAPQLIVFVAGTMEQLEVIKMNPS